MATPNLAFVEIAVGQLQKEVTHNQGLAEIEGAMTEVIAFNVTSAETVVPTTLEFQRNFLFDLNPDGGDPPTGNITMTVPAIERGIFAVRNDTTELTLVTIASQPDTVPSVATGQVGIFISDGINVRSGAGGALTFLQLLDIDPTSYSGQALKNVRVNATADGLDFAAVSSGVVNLSALRKGHEGAVVNRTTNLAVVTATSTLVPWEEALLDTTFSRDNGLNVQKFWLGLNLVFTANVSDDLTATAHGMTTGDGPLRVITTTTLPSPLAVDTNYWVIRVDDNTIQLATTRANSLSSTQIDITDTGTGTHTLDRENRLVIPEGVTKVKLVAQVQYAANTTGRRTAAIQKNDTSSFDLLPEDSSIAENQIQALNPVSHVTDVTLGDYFGFELFQDSGGNLNALAELTNLSIEVVESTNVLAFPNIMVEQQKFGAMAVKTGTQAISSSTDTPLTWDAVEYEVPYLGNNFFDLGTDDTIITIPTGVTKVIFYGGVNDTQGCIVRLERDIGGGFLGGEDIMVGQGASTSSQDHNFPHFASAPLEVSAGDKYRIFVRNTTAGTINVVYSYFAILVLQTDQILTFPGVTIERPQIGALVSKSASQTLTDSVLAEVSYNTTEYDTGYKGTLFFDDGNDALVIPAGVTKVKLTAGLTVAGTTIVQVFMQFQKNDAGFAGLVPADHAGTVGDEFITITSPVIEVIEGDSFTVDVQVNATTPTVVASATVNVFAIEVIETDEAAFPPEEIDFFINGTPATSDMIFLKVASRRFSLKDELADSEAFAVTAPSGGAVAFDVQRDAVSIGTITFADTANTATFVTSGGSQEDFEIGERLSVHSPGNLQSMADIAFNLLGFRT